MKETPLLLRWGIPGTIFFGVFFFFVFVDKFWTQLHYVDIYYDLASKVNHHSLISRMDMNDQFKEYSLVGIVAFFISASIPIGFIISQLYYFGYWAHFPFRSRRNAGKILNKSELDKLWIKYKIKKLVDTEILHDNARWRETVPTIFLWLLYLIMFVLHYTVIFPITFLLNIPFRVINLFKVKKLRLYQRNYTLVTPSSVKGAHYEWAALDWFCMQKANPDEVERIENLGHIFHGLGTTFIAVLSSWFTFLILHKYLPNHNLLNGDGSVYDGEIFWINFGIVVFLFFIIWQNRKDVARHQLLIMRALYDRKTIIKKINHKKKNEASINSEHDINPIVH